MVLVSDVMADRAILVKSLVVSVPRFVKLGPQTGVTVFARVPSRSGHLWKSTISLIDTLRSKGHSPRRGQEVGIMEAYINALGGE